MTYAATHDVPPTFEELHNPERIQRLFGVDLTLLDEAAEHTPTLPLEAFGKWKAWIETAADDAGCPNDYVAASLLATAAAAVGNSRCVAGADNGWFPQPCVLWAALVGGPSTHKTPGLQATTNALKTIEQEEWAAHEPERLKHQEEIEIAKAHEAAWKDAVARAIKSGEPPPSRPAESLSPHPFTEPQIIVGDTTPEALAGIAASNPRGVIVVRDELAALLGGFDRYKAGGSERAMFLEAYGAGSYRVSRKAAGTVTIPRLAVSIVGGLQPERFSELIANTADDGLQARFLYVYPRRRPFEGRRNQRTDTPRIQAAFRALRKLQMRDSGNGPEPVTLPLEPDASEAFETWMKEHDAAPRIGSTRLQSWMGKSAGSILRIALNIELLEWAYNEAGHPPQQVSFDSLGKAIALHDYFAQMAVKTFFGGAQSQTEVHARAIARWIAGHFDPDEPDTAPLHAVSEREVYKGFRIAGIKSPNEAKAALNFLVDAGWLTHEPARADGKPGRRAQKYEIRTDVWGALSELQLSCQ